MGVYSNYREWKLAEINGGRCLTMMNGMMERLSNRKWRELLGRDIFGTKETELPSLSGGTLSVDYQWKSIRTAE